ncbi:hypothetical protein [Mycolicibacter arupensis]|uniref:Phage head morphogenesis domain-containing protein n=1 Tax=Mycolicibacter arupensis TaxID=342002 RepID=A0A5C7XL39_9MYCO|nr:hypothetical protein [Mycolicibacter arupensis]TXI50192.1 MAG: hypothetical protein E6Q54_21730 [Mycolicibacter arupensis]
MSIVVSEYQRALLGLADRTQRATLVAHDEHLAGNVAEDIAVEVMAEVVNAAIGAAVGLADRWLARQIEHALRRPVPSIGLPPKDHTGRLRKAFRTIFGRRREQEIDDDESRMQTGRVGHSEPLEAGQRATTEAMQQHPMLQGWVRQFDDDPCQLCQWWARDGRIWPADHPMPTHKGCNCSQRIVLAENIKETLYTKRLHREQAPDGTQFPREGEQ